MSTLYTDNIRANNASQITLPTGQKIVGTDEGSISSPGNVIQVKQLTSNGGVTVTATGWTNSHSGLHLQITPKSASSKFLVMYNIWGILYGGSKHFVWDLTRSVGGVQSARFGESYGLGSVYTGQITETQLMCHLEYLDSPNTTSTITYIPQFNNINTGSSATFGNGSRRSTITAMEIAQ